MSVSTKLYINTRWKLDDIKDVLAHTQGKEVTIKSNHSIAMGYFCFFVGSRQIHVHAYHPSPIGSATVLSMGANTEGQEILRGIAEVLGGILMDNDCDGKCELIDGAMDDDNALPYFIKYAIVNDGIDPDDLEGFLESKANWHNKIEKRHIKYQLKELKC